jgi:uncharacterized protein (TIGR03435 family)
MVHLLAILLAFCIPGAAQSFGGAPSFDVASVRPSVANGPQNLAPETLDPGRWAIRRMPMIYLLMRAYALPSYRVAFPQWMNEERFDIVATFPAGTANETRLDMLRNLLAERFHLAVHRETREMVSWDLVVARNGSKLTPAGDKGGKPGISLMTRSGSKGLNSTITARAQAISDLAPFLSRQLNAPVNDRTGLEGKYDFILEFLPGWAGEPSTVEDSFYPALLTAVQEQLGLKLEPRKALAEMLVVDKADKVPTEN